MSASVTFVIPTFNRAADLPRTLWAIANQQWPCDACEVLVIDNGSTDDTAAVLSGLSLPVPLRHVVKQPEGPAAARNLGLTIATGSFVAFVDSDVALTPGWTAAAVEAMRDDTGLAQVGGPVVFAHDDTLLNCYGGAVGPLGLAWDLDEGSDLAAASAPRDVLWSNNSATLVRPEPVRAVGGYDESFFYGYEETDLGLRLAIAGWRARVVPGAVAVHHVGTTIGTSDPGIVFHYTKNRLRMGLKAFCLARLAWWVPVSVGYGLLDAALHVPRLARLRAMLWAVRTLPDTLRSRRAAQSARTLGDGDAFRLMRKELFPPRRLAGRRRRPVRGTIESSATDDRVGKPA